jgi:hypothetical protein
MLTWNSIRDVGFSHKLKVSKRKLNQDIHGNPLFLNLYHGGINALASSNIPIWN